LDDIASGMTYLHRKNIVHGDLKGVNILVGSDHHALLSDFGISKLVGENNLTPHSAASPSPECFGGSKATTASDVYSFTMTGWEVR
ncbi:v-abl, partial [Stereum hirsutum FP-91666 SS1]|uniref:v-abl n=1 Tax=Stereum hirsutum (strain FP-91666) TaxID=721885 RepID=UPI000444951E